MKVGGGASGLGVGVSGRRARTYVYMGDCVCALARYVVCICTVQKR